LDKKEWNEKVHRCPKAAEGFEPYHKWIAINKSINPGSESVSMLMCGICFHEVNISEAFKHRDVFKTSQNPGTS